MKRHLDLFRWAVVGGLAVMGWFNYRGMIHHIMQLFAEPPEDMAHGWFVPLVSVAVVWTQRKALRQAQGLPSWRGFAWFCFYWVVAWFGGRGGQSRIEQVSLIGLIWATAYALWGRQVARVMLFPVGYLVFTIPMSSFTDFFTIHLRILSSSLAVWLLNGFGVMVEQSGTALFSHTQGATFNVDVAQPCSGIRSLFAMMALMAGYAFYTQRTGMRKVLLFMCSIPIAMIGNIARIISICLVATWFGQDVATGYYHDYSGYVVFLVGVLLMIQAGEWIRRSRWACPGCDRLRGWVSGRQGAAEHPADEPSFRHFCLAGLVLVTGVTFYTVKRVLPMPTYVDAELVAPDLPERIGGFVGVKPWFCHNEQCLAVIDGQNVRQTGEPAQGELVCPRCGGKLYDVALSEEKLLPKGTTLLKRAYRAMDGVSYSMTVVVSGWNRAGIHRPELCLPSQGYTMSKAEKMALQIKAPGVQEVRCITVQRPNEEPSSLVYWFFTEERSSCSHVERILADIWDRSIHNRINRWVMIAANVSPALSSPERVKQFEAFLSEFYQEVRLER